MGEPADGATEREKAANPASIVVQRRLQWSDTDASGLYHNTAVMRLFEAAETLLLDRLGLLEEVYGRLPRVRIEIDFLQPLVFHEVVRVRVDVVDLGRSSIGYAFSIDREDGPAARGRVVAVLMDPTTGRPGPWSPEHRRRLEGAGTQAPEFLHDG